MSEPQTHAAFLAPEIAELSPLFPGYQIECLIATGGMGAVYRAIQKSLDRTVAIKILPQEFSKDAAFCSGFEAEAKAMARLNHPNLIGVYDFGEVKGMLYIIMEFVPGKSVFHSANGTAINSGEVIRLVTGICNGLSHAHENGILHRDIKPSNILLDLNAQPKIGDFGLARPIGTKVQEGEEIFGTPHYTAPEVVNSPQSVGYRADIFSVGVMLHELLTGRLPADDQRPASAIVHCDPRFDAIIRRATNPLAELRYASASEIARDLQAIAASSGPKAARTVAAKAPPRPVSGPNKPKMVRAAPKKTPSPLPGIIMLLVAIAVAFSAYKYYTNNFAKPSQPVVPASDVPSAATRKKTPVEIVKPGLDSSSKPWVNPDSTPARETFPKVDSKSNTSSGLNSTTETKPDPSAAFTTPETPKFDVPGFFERARKIMQDRANPMIAIRNESLVKNLADYERAIKRLIRKLDFGRAREIAESSLENYMELCRETGNQIPEKLDDKVISVSDIKDIHREFFEKQESIEALLMQSLSQLSATYILGLEKQIERLKTQDDPAAVAQITEEIDKSRATELYFPYLMLGIDPEAKKDKDENQEQDGDKKTKTE